MAKKDSKKQPSKKQPSPSSNKRAATTSSSSGNDTKKSRLNVKRETKRSMLGILFFVFAAFFILASLSVGGVAGSFVFKMLDSLLGLGYVFLPIILFLVGLSLFKNTDPGEHIALPKTLGAILFFVSSLGLTSIFFAHTGGGFLGNLISSPLIKLFDIYVASISLVAFIIISLLLIFDAPLSPDSAPLSWLRAIKSPILFGNKKEDNPTIVTMDDGDEDDSPDENGETDDGEEDEDADDTSLAAAPIPTLGKKIPTEEDLPAIATGSYPLQNHTYTPPPISLLSPDKGKPDVGDIKGNANIIKRTLQNFGITVEMDEISVGPTVTRYALKPAEGVKLSRIVGLQNDLGLALAAHPVRIEAPIPGKSLVGIEVPNAARSTIGLAKLLSAPEFVNSEKPLLFALGRGISGQSFFANLAKLPHMLIAGTTGSGKSVTIHAILASLIYKNGPERMRFIMIDPKRVELTMYNNIPHLLTPVITEPKKAILALKWAAKEMDRRYDILETESVRDISSYHENVVGPAYKAAKNKGGDSESAKLPEAMPYIVIVIDELADIMTSYPRELESAIVRLAQMSRAVGIHLILSTQRPSVNVITGLIKANVPGRIALQVSSQIDSRTILDTGGAEKLLGAGDMLYLSSDMSQPQRIQSAYVTEGELKRVVAYLRKEYAGEDFNDITMTDNTGKPSSLEEIMNGSVNSGNDSGDDDDDMYEEARQTVIEAGKASTSFLQRKLKVGYARAARLMDMLEERGVVGPGEGAKPREVLAGKSAESEGYGE
ncbi:MAG: DNA translocase FtsK [Candidatus Yonathbacteria bacterium]|nr:DNA translocase FtsK [Candidatus Yonathbacteria bacterium]